jgi:hypothetical protein
VFFAYVLVLCVLTGVDVTFCYCFQSKICCRLLSFWGGFLENLRFVAASLACLRTEVRVFFSWLLQVIIRFGEARLLIAKIRHFDDIRAARLALGKSEHRLFGQLSGHPPWARNILVVNQLPKNASK